MSQITTADYEKAVNAYDRNVGCVLTFDDFEVSASDIKKLSVTNAISTSDFEIGTVNSAKFEAQLSAKLNPSLTQYSLKNCWVSVSFIIEGEDDTYKMSVGYFKIDKPNTEDNIITITGYDAVAQMDVTYKPADIYPTTVRNVVLDILATCELELSEDTFPNEDLTIEDMPEWGDITCREALGYIAELAGCCVIADTSYSKTVRFIQYGAPKYTIKPSMYYSLKVDESSFSGINSVFVVSDDKDLAWYSGGDEKYTITDNPLLTDKDTAKNALNEIKETLKYTAYRPFEMNYIGNPALNVGDGVMIIDTKGNTYTSVICSHTLTYDGGLRGTMSAYIDTDATDRGSGCQSYSTQLKTVQNTANEAKKTAQEAKDTADEVRYTLDNLPEISVDVVNTNVVKSDTMQAIWCFSKYMFVQFMETNFEALDVNKTYTQLRKYIRIFDDNIKVIEAELSDTETESYKDPNGQKLYWTAVTGTNAYKFFTYTSPLTIAKGERPEDITDSEFEDLYTVKVRKTVAEYVKCSLGFPLNSSGTGEPELVFGTGDENGYGKYKFVKDSDSGRFVYVSRIDGKEYGIAIKDDGVYQNTAEKLTKMYPIAVVNNVSEADDLPVGTLVFVGAVGGD